MSIDEELEKAPAAAVRRARAWLSRVAEPGTIDFWRYVEDQGPVEAGRSPGCGPVRTRAWPTSRGRSGAEPGW